jgi:SulP family sulfate permease
MQTIFKPKFFSLLKKGMTRDQVRTDILSGIVVGIVALPLSIAFAVSSGVSPEKGLITAIIAGFLISFLGGSRVQIGGPTGAFIVIVYGIIEKHGLNGLLISTVMAGIILVLFGLLKLGTLLKYFPHPLIIGFTSGIALIIFSTQIRDALGLPVDSVPSEFLEKWHIYFQYFSQINPAALAITAVAILISLGSKKLLPRIPGSFLAIVIITLAVKLLNIPVATIETFFGDIPNRISFQMPHFESHMLLTYLPSAITIALLGAIESLLSAVVSDGMIGANHRSNTELIAQGIANICTPFFGGIPATGAIARTATNVRSGGRTPLAGIVHAVTLLLIMFFLGKWAKLIPMSCLAGILIIVSINMSEWRSFLAIMKGNNFDKLILVTTFLLTVLVDLTVAIQVGVVLSSLLFMKRMGDIPDKRIDHVVDTDVLENHPVLPEGVAIYEISGPFFFASARRYSELIREVGLKNKVLILRFHHVHFIDQTGIKALMSTLEILRGEKIAIVLAGINKEVSIALHKENINLLIPDENIFDTLINSLDRAKELILS